MPEPRSSDSDACYRMQNPNPEMGLMIVSPSNTKKYVVCALLVSPAFLLLRYPAHCPPSLKSSSSSTGLGLHKKGEFQFLRILLFLCYASFCPLQLYQLIAQSAQIISERIEIVEERRTVSSWTKGHDLPYSWHLLPTCLAR